MRGMCVYRPVGEGGIGFDYRLQMAIADMWIDVMKLHDDYAWGMGHIIHTLTNRRCAPALSMYPLFCLRSVFPCSSEVFIHTKPEFSVASSAGAASVL